MAVYYMPPANVQSNYVRVNCDGYGLHIHLGDATTSSDFIEIYDSGFTTEYAKNRCYHNLSSGRYAIGVIVGAYDAWSVLEDGPSRKIIYINSYLRSSSTGSSVGAYKIWIYIYSDYWILRGQFVPGSSVTRIAKAHYECWAAGIFRNTGLTSPQVKYPDSATTEANVSGVTYYNTEDYLVLTATQMDITCGTIYSDFSDDATAVWQQYAYDSDEMPFRPTDAEDLSAGTYEWVVYTIVDATARSGGKQYNSAATRIEIGDQWKDTTMADPDAGSWVTDLNIPANIGVDGFASDGAIHVKPDTNDEVKITLDRDRYNQPIVHHDDGFRTWNGTSADERCIEHFLFNDNAASSTVVATIGNNATWEDSSGTGRNTSNDTVTDGAGQDSGLDTKDTYHVDLATTVYTNAVYKSGGMMLTFTPQWAYDDAADQTLFILYVDSDDYIQLVYDVGNDRYELRVSWGGTLTTINGSAYTESASLQQLTTIMAAWDSDNDFLALMINGQVAATGTNTGTPSASAGAYVHVGADSDGDGTTSLNADVVLDMYRAFDGPPLCFGGGAFLDHVNDYANPHESVTLRWDGSDTTPIGSDITSNGDYTQTAPSGNNWFRNDAAGEYATAVTSGNIAASEGQISFWFQPNAALGADCTLFYADAAFKIWWDDSDNDVVFTYNTDVLNQTTAFAADDTNAHFIRIGWLASTRLFIEVDGEMNTLSTGVDAAPTLDTNMYFTADDASGTNRANVMMGDLTITDKIDTPDMWSVMGNPKIIKQLEVQ